MKNMSSQGAGNAIKTKGETTLRTNYTSLVPYIFLPLYCLHSNLSFHPQFHSQEASGQGSF
jgi:hypothetical protein